MAAKPPCPFCGEGVEGVHAKAQDCIKALKVALLLARRVAEKATAK